MESHFAGNDLPNDQVDPVSLVQSADAGLKGFQQPYTPDPDVPGMEPGNTNFQMNWVDTSGPMEIPEGCMRVIRVWTLFGLNREFVFTNYDQVETISRGPAGIHIGFKDQTEYHAEGVVTVTDCIERLPSH